MSMGRYVLRRTVLLLFILVGISVITFVLTRVVPSDPAALYVGPLARQDQIDAARAELGLDRPLAAQYGRYVAGLTRGDFGTSLRTHRPVRQDIARYLPSTLELVFTSLLLALVIGIPLGTLSARYRGSWLDHVGRVVSIAGVSVPSFWLGLLFQVLFFRILRWLPVGGRLDSLVEQTHPVQAVTGFYVLDTVLQANWVAFGSVLAHLVLPALTLTAYPLGTVTRMTRATMLEVLEQDYVRAARAYGLSSWAVTFWYGLKNAMAPVLTIVGLTFAYSLTGAFFVEIIFAWPGLGTYAVKAILSTDYPAIMGVTMTVALFYVISNLAVDLMQAWLDPRVTLR